MKIIYCPTYELNGDLGYSSPIGLEFNNIEDLKEQIMQDYSSEEYRFASIDISFDDVISLYFDSPHTLKVMYQSSKDLWYQIDKNDNCHVSDLVQHLEEFYHSNDSD